MMRKIEDRIIVINPWYWKNLFPSIPTTHYLWIGLGISNGLLELKKYYSDQFYWLVCYRGILKDSQVDWDPYMGWFSHPTATTNYTIISESSLYVVLTAQEIWGLLLQVYLCYLKQMKFASLWLLKGESMWLHLFHSKSLLSNERVLLHGSSWTLQKHG